MSVAAPPLTDLALNEEGFFLHPEDWKEEMVPALAAREGITQLSDRHWQVIRFMRSEYFAKGTGPTVRVLGKTSGVSIKELYQLFPKPTCPRPLTRCRSSSPRGRWTGSTPD